MADIKTVLGVGKRFNHKYPRRNLVHRAKRKRTLFFLDSQGKLRTIRVGFIKSLYYNRIKSFQRVLECTTCQRKVKETKRAARTR